MVNEPCLKGCPARISHISEIDFCHFNCNIIKNNIKTIPKMPAIYPWDLGYYSAIGINNFKITPRKFTRAKCISMEYLDNYLNCVENGPETYNFGNFCYDMFYFELFKGNDLIKTKLTDMIPYLQDIRYFTKYGDLCATRCNATCNRCEKMGIELEKAIKRLS